MLRGNWELFAVEEKGRPHTLIHTEHTNTTIRMKKNTDPKLDDEVIAFFVSQRKDNFRIINLKVRNIRQSWDHMRFHLVWSGTII